MTTTVFGIRHHGPGSARSLVEDLRRLGPDCVLIEGPPDADALIPLAAEKEMRPPVALLIFDPDQPHDGAFFPFAVFSPEWQAIKHGLGAGVPVRFIDLGVGYQLARGRADREKLLAELAKGEEGGDEAATESDRADETEPTEETEPADLSVSSGPTPSASWRAGREKKRTAMTTTVFGIRHHGPGSARSLVEDLRRLGPDCVLIEGPPDADALIPLAADKGMRPPVALLIYDPDQPHDGAFFPFAVFSPEWQAIKHGLGAGVPVRFIDLGVGYPARARARGA